MEYLTTRVLEAHPSVLEVEGEIDMSTADGLRTALQSALDADPALVVDLGGVTFFDAAGIRALLQVAATRNGEGPLVLRNATRITRILDIVGLKDVVSIAVDDDREPCGR